MSKPKSQQEGQIKFTRGSVTHTEAKHKAFYMPGAVDAGKQFRFSEKGDGRIYVVQQDGSIRRAK